jgi:SAM-dependent methyltransferase
MTEPDRERLRASFGEDAERYDRRRPGYPSELFDDIAALVPAGSRSRVLEIGCGTGQATLPMARLGYTIVAVELSTDLAAIARRNLAGFDNVAVVVSAFEDWAPPDTPFDLVLSATAFHWLDPDTRMTRTADVLRPDGVAAIVSTHHVAGGTASFFVDAQGCYERYDPSTPPGLRLEHASDIPTDSTEFDESDRFGTVGFRRYEWEETYTADEYVDLLLTYSGHRTLEPAAQDGLLTCIANLINDDHAGRITKRYLTQLATARRMA